MTRPVTSARERGRANSAVAAYALEATAKCTLTGRPRQVLFLAWSEDEWEMMRQRLINRHEPTVASVDEDTLRQEPIFYGDFAYAKTCDRCGRDVSPRHLWADHDRCAVARAHEADQLAEDTRLAQLEQDRFLDDEHKE